ncbi:MULTISPECIES: DUF2281 domain-containing protein [unclassified Ectothiorhodospira]|uniref:DUF2281 domain-containing protein n=1 Tax=unclassified Ectothiorhodospira TaxID=2684909 RepID=UPI001EE7E50B|nr:MULTISPECIES: DUF2281 domain-containing protein [unclassified Ectothiorhodospira]MCG5516403.1 DUF2281 domain-containing protein [Ectothiorhodospira sp. 9100]MCG5519347.1 DUF2281 domain-containing protein [Ectothiorhodospira sp. 9905]
MHIQKTKTLIDKLQQLPPERIGEVEDFIDFLRSRGYGRRQTTETLQDFPVDHIDHWPEDLGLSRDDLYGDDGR